MSTRTVARGRVAALSRSRTADDPDLIAARQSLKAAGLEEHIAAVVDSAPPLSAEQRERLAGILRGAVPGAAA